MPMSRERDLNSEPTRRQRNQARMQPLPLDIPDPSRRDFLKKGLLLAGGGVLALGGGALALRTWLGKSELDIVVEDYETKGRKIDGIIEKADLSMATLRGLAEDGLSDYPKEQRDLILFPIDIYERNRGNKYRNLYKYRAERIRSEGLSALEEEIILEDDYHFLFDFLPPDAKNRTTAAYTPAIKAVGLRRNLQGNLMDALEIYHEMKHVIQDTKFRSYLDSEEEWVEYVNFFQGERLTIVEYEQEAYLYEIEMLNALLKGELKTDLATGERNLGYFADLLGVSEDQLPALIQILGYAKIAYDTGTNIDYVAPEFADVVNGNYRAMGFELYTEDNGTITPLDR